MSGRGVEQDADDLVLNEAKPLGTSPPVSIFEQFCLRDLAGLRELALQQLRNGCPKQVVFSAVLLSERVDFACDTCAVEYHVVVREEWGRHAVHSIRITDGGNGVTSGFRRNEPSVLFSRPLARATVFATCMSAAFVSLAG